jgi:hypothetical protein
MSAHHKHQHVLAAIGSGKNIDEAIFNAVAGLTDPQGHGSNVTFNSFEVVNIKGTIAHNPGDHGTPDQVQVTIQGTGTHGQ